MLSIRHRLSPYIIILLLFPLWISTEPSWGEENELPQWEHKDQTLMFRGELITGEALLPDEETQILSPDAEFPVILPEENTNIEDATKNIPARFIPLYLPQYNEQTILDPQTLLTEQEKEDIQKLLLDIKAATGTNIYLSVFNSTQELPPALNAHTLARNIFLNKSCAIFLEYHRNKPSATQIIFSEDLNHCLDDIKRKSFLDAIQREAGNYENDLDRLWISLFTVGEKIPALMEQAKSRPLAKKIVVPQIDYQFNNNPQEKKKSLDKFYEKIGPIWIAYQFIIYSFFLIILIIIIAPLIWIKTRCTPLPARKNTFQNLGAPQGSSTTRVLYYSGNNSAEKKEKDFLKDLLK